MISLCLFQHWVKLLSYFIYFFREVISHTKPFPPWQVLAVRYDLLLIFEERNLGNYRSWMLIYFFLAYAGWDSISSRCFFESFISLWRKFLRTASVSSGDFCSLSLMLKNLILFLLLKHSCFTTLRATSSSLTILLVVTFSVAAVTLACSFKTSTSACVDSTLALSSSFSFSSFATWIFESCISGNTDSSQLSSLPCSLQHQTVHSCGS